jgi:hypothetical protein
VDSLLLHIRQNLEPEANVLIIGRFDRAAAEGDRRPGADARGREHLVRVGEQLAGGAHLLEAVDAIAAAGRFASGLDGRQQQGHQHADDGDHDQQLDEGETGVPEGEFPSPEGVVVRAPISR